VALQSERCGSRAIRPGSIRRRPLHCRGHESPARGAALDVVELDLTHPEQRRRFDALFESCPGAFVQQSTLWSDVIAELGPDRPIFLVCSAGGRDVAGLPLYLFEHPLGNVLSSVPQAGPLGGVFCRPELGEPERDRAYASLLRKADGIAREAGCLSLTLLTNPFRPDLALYERHLAPDHVLENFTQSIALDQVVIRGRIALRDLERRTSLSRNLRKARASGLEVGPCRSDEDFEAWLRVHETAHARLGVEPLPRRLLENARRVLEPAGKALLLLAKAGAEIASGCLYVLHRDVLDVFILSMNADYAELGPNFLLTEHSLLWAAQRSVKTYNWQSSPSRKSGVYRYKTQWGSRESLYYFVTRRLCAPQVLERIGLARLRTEYRGHYVVPFGVFRDGFERLRFAK
jgi:CelD/BcsL family acetyltransferase involved in cellulose biosynthesis